MSQYTAHSTHTSYHYIQYSNCTTLISDVGYCWGRMEYLGKTLDLWQGIEHQTNYIQTSPNGQLYPIARKFCPSLPMSSEWWIHTCTVYRNWNLCPSLYNSHKFVFRWWQLYRSSTSTVLACSVHRDWTCNPTCRECFATVQPLIPLLIMLEQCLTFVCEMYFFLFFQDHSHGAIIFHETTLGFWGKSS